jgi:hypothetical protein
MSQSQTTDERLGFSPEQLMALARDDFSIFVELMFPILHDGQSIKHAPEPLAKLLAEVGSRSLFACNGAVFRRLSWPWRAFRPIFHGSGHVGPAAVAAAA